MPRAAAAGAPFECAKCGRPADSEYLFFDAVSRHTLFGGHCAVGLSAIRIALGPPRTTLVRALTRLDETFVVFALSLAEADVGRWCRLHPCVAADMCHGRGIIHCVLSVLRTVLLSTRSPAY